MTQEAEKPSRKAEHFARKLAAHNAAAFREFGDALEQFGDGAIDASKVVRIAGDLYFREVARMASEMIGAFSEAWDWGLTRSIGEARAAGASAHDVHETTRAPTRHRK
jgi:hypothetical protein